MWRTSWGTFHRGSGLRGDREACGECGELDVVSPLQGGVEKTVRRVLSTRLARNLMLEQWGVFKGF